jgi:anti-anti-sigma regulatory factor
LARIVSWDEEPAVLRCWGDEDLATQALRRTALARAKKAEGDVAVDLSGLVFADSSLVFDLAILAQRLRGQDRSLLLRDAQPQIARLLEHVGLPRQPGVQVIS